MALKLDLVCPDLLLLGNKGVVSGLHWKIQILSSDLTSQTIWVVFFIPKCPHELANDFLFDESQNKICSAIF